MTDVLLVADTHLGATAADRLIERIAPELAIADVIVHAGDITELGVLDALAAHAVVHAVKGNNDHGLDLPEREIVTVDGCTFAVVHDSGPSVGRAGAPAPLVPGCRRRRVRPLAPAVARDATCAPTATSSTTSTPARRCCGGGRRRARWPTSSSTAVEVAAVRHVAVG